MSELIVPRLYGHFNPAGTRTGRLSSSKPNLQNQPARGELGHLVRSLYVPAPGHVFVIYDLDAVEYRVLCDLADETKMVERFIEAERTGVPADPHLWAASAIHHEEITDKHDPRRGPAKTSNYLAVFGGGAGRLSQQAKIPFAEAKAFFRVFWNEVLPHVPAWKKSIYAEAEQKGYIELRSGRRRRVHDIFSSDQGLRAYSERQLVSGAVQGTAADIQVKATLNVNKWTGEIPILHVHDECVFEVPEDDEERIDLLCYTIPRAVADAAKQLKLRVPITAGVKVGSSWAAKGD